MKKIVIIGAGGFGREVAWLIKRINQVNMEWNLLGFVDSNEQIHGQEVGGIKVLGGLEYFEGLKEKIYVVCAIGTPNIREKLMKQIEDNEYVEYPVLIDPTANVLLDEVRIGEGSIVCANTTLTTNITIGKHVILNLHCSVGHDTEIGDYTVICPNAAIGGESNIGKGIFFGNSCSIRNRISIGNDCMIGMGSVVTKDIPSRVVAYGNPIKIVKEI